MKNFRKGLAILAVTVCTAFLITGCGNGRKESDTEKATVGNTATERTSDNATDKIANDVSNGANDTKDIKDNTDNKAADDAANRRDDGTDDTGNDGAEEKSGLSEVGEGIGQVGEGIVDGAENIVDDLTGNDRDTADGTEMR